NGDIVDNLTRVIISAVRPFYVTKIWLLDDSIFVNSGPLRELTGFAVSYLTRKTAHVLLYFWFFWFFWLHSVRVFLHGTTERTGGTVGSSDRNGRLMGWLGLVHWGGLSNLRAGGTGDDQSRLRLEERARHTTFNQVLVLVVIDVEVIEGGDFATLVGTNGVVRKVDNDAEQVGWVAILVGEEVIVNLDNVGNIQRTSESFLGVVVTVTFKAVNGALTEKQQVSDETLGGVQGWGTGTLVRLTHCEERIHHF